MDVGYLRSKVDFEGKYVDFGVLRTALNISVVAKDLGIRFSEPSYEGECRAKCPKCGKERSLSVNINTGRFYCFAKSCPFKGGGAIDLFSRLHEISAKEASHLLAFSYGITPYGENGNVEDPTTAGEPTQAAEESEKEMEASDSESGSTRISDIRSDSEPWVSKDDFQNLEAKFNRLSNILFGHMLECDRSSDVRNEHDPPPTQSRTTVNS